MTTRTVDTFSQPDIFTRAALARTSKRVARRRDWAGLAMIAFVVAVAMLHLASGVLHQVGDTSYESMSAIVGP